MYYGGLLKNLLQGFKHIYDPLKNSSMGESMK
jgi:hypothetical protein